MPRPRKVQKVADALFTSRGHTDTALRKAVAARAGALGGAKEDGDVPADLRDYVEKVALHAYRITDDDIAALKAAGYTEDAIFEITASAALGASLARMDRGLSALKGDR